MWVTTGAKWRSRAVRCIPMTTQCYSSPEEPHISTHTTDFLLCFALIKGILKDILNAHQTHFNGLCTKRTA